MRTRWRSLSARSVWGPLPSCRQPPRAWRTPSTSSLGTCRRWSGANEHEEKDNEPKSQLVEGQATHFLAELAQAVAREQATQHMLHQVTTQLATAAEGCRELDKVRERCRALAAAATIVLGRGIWGQPGVSSSDQHAYMRLEALSWKT